MCQPRGPGFETPPVAGCIGTDDVNFSSKNLQWDGDEWAYALSPLRAKICGICHVAEGTAGGGHHFTEKSVVQTRGSGFGGAISLLITPSAAPLNI